MPSLRALASLALLSNAPIPQLPAGHYPDVRQMVCEDGTGRIWTGTAFEAGGQMISVAHVTNGGTCKIYDSAVLSVQVEGLDLSTAHGSVKGYRINCGGFVLGENYWAVGYANSVPVQRVVHLIGTGVLNRRKMAVLLGDPSVIPGMSGGPIINAQGEVVGTVNAYLPGKPISYSQEMKGTALCKGIA